MRSSSQLSLTLLRRCRVALASSVLFIIVQLYRRWLKKRRQQTAVESAAHVDDIRRRSHNLPAAEAGTPESRVGARPPPRPGMDTDERFQSIEDDPRYFNGADLGKTQLAVLGAKFESGINTVSFDPASTLVRPSMRVVLGSPSSQPESFTPDDIMVVPELLCGEQETRIYEELVDDLKKLVDVKDSSAYQQALRDSCTYSSLSQNDAERQVHVVWYRNSADQEPHRYATSLDEDSLQKCNCMLTLTLGAPCELAFRETDSEERICFPSKNGSLHILGRAVSSNWHRRVEIGDRDPRLDTRMPEGSGDGFIVITIIGYAPIAVHETKLAPTPARNVAPLKDGGHANPNSARPAMRIRTLTTAGDITRLSHDDVIIVPGFFCAQDDWDMYYNLLREMRASQAKQDANAQWTSWHEGSHLLTKNPDGSETFQSVLSKICDYFAIANRECRDGNAVGTRFNWYRDGSDWKPFHHDSAAFNKQRATKQNCTVGVSFGASRELAFRHARSGQLIYFPQTNGMLFFFGRDVNIRWQHGINALPAEEQDGKGRISIILWGLTTLATQETESPSMLVDSHEDKGKGKGKRRELCRAFQSGNCAYGDRCRFVHKDGDGRGSDICRSFQRTGSCNFGNNCKFAHVIVENFRQQQHGGA